MKYRIKIKGEIKNSFPLVNLLSDDTIANLNKRFGTHITKQITSQIKIRRKDKSFEWWNRLIRTKPGFEKVFKKGVFKKGVFKKDEKI